MYTGPGCKTRIVPGKVKSSSSAYVPPPDQRVKLPGGAQGPTVSATDGPIVSEASPGDTSDTSDTGSYGDITGQGDASGEVPSDTSSGEEEVHTEDAGVTSPDQPATTSKRGDTSSSDSAAQGAQSGTGVAGDSTGSNTVTVSEGHLPVEMQPACSNVLFCSSRRSCILLAVAGLQFAK
jgi:hypothetical protein